MNKKIFNIVKIRTAGELGRELTQVTIPKELSNRISGTHCTMKYKDGAITATICTLKIDPKRIDEIYKVRKYKQASHITIPSKILSMIDGTHVMMEYDGKNIITMKVLKFNK